MLGDLTLQNNTKLCNEMSELRSISFVTSRFKLGLNRTAAFDNVIVPMVIPLLNMA